MLITYPSILAVRETSHYKGEESKAYGIWIVGIDATQPIMIPKEDYDKIILALSEREQHIESLMTRNLLELKESCK